jgi:hypothetical protein
VNIIEHIHGQAEISFRGSLGIFRLTSQLMCILGLAISGYLKVNPESGMN